MSHSQISVKYPYQAEQLEKALVGLERNLGIGSDHPEVAQILRAFNKAVSAREADLVVNGALEFSIARFSLEAAIATVWLRTTMGWPLAGVADHLTAAQDPETPLGKRNWNAVKAWQVCNDLYDQVRYALPEVRRRMEVYEKLLAFFSEWNLTIDRWTLDRLQNLVDAGRQNLDLGIINQAIDELNVCTSEMLYAFVESWFIDFFKDTRAVEVFKLAHEEYIGFLAEVAEGSDLVERVRECKKFFKRTHALNQRREAELRRVARPQPQPQSYDYFGAGAQGNGHSNGKGKGKKKANQWKAEKTRASQRLAQWQ